MKTVVGNILRHRLRTALQRLTETAVRSSKELKIMIKLKVQKFYSIILLRVLFFFQQLVRQNSFHNIIPQLKIYNH